MADLEVKHYLRIYTIRMRMQEEGITNPSEEIKLFTKTFVEKLLLLPPDEKIFIRKNSFIDCRGNVIVTLPKEQN